MIRNNLFLFFCIFLFFSCSSQEEETLEPQNQKKHYKNKNSGFVFNNRISRYLPNANVNVDYAKKYVSNLEYTVSQLLASNIDLGNPTEVNRIGKEADLSFAQANNLTISTVYLPEQNLEQYLVSSLNSNEWTKNQTDLLNEVKIGIQASNEYQEFITIIENILQSQKFVRLSENEKIKFSNFIIQFDYTLQYLEAASKDGKDGKGGKKEQCDGWWACWGKCAAGIVGGAIGGTIGGAAAGSTVPWIGTIAGGVGGAISGGLSGAVAGCG